MHLATVLFREVESLLRAHDDAGEFLDSPPPKPAALAHTTSVLNPAVHAEAFLRGCANPTDEQRERFLAQLPEAIRHEARERIQAGLRVRALRQRERRPRSEQAQEAPRLPGFRIERKLGEGGLGVVYAAHDEKLHRRVAIKVLRHRADAQVRGRLLGEARHTAGLGDPAVVTVFSVLDETDPPAIVMEFVEGFPLDRFAAQLNFDALVRYDVWIYLAFALFFATLAPFRSRWRMLVGGLLGCGLGSYLLVDLGLVARKPFIIGLGAAGLVVALGAFAYLRRGAGPWRWFGKQVERNKTNDPADSSSFSSS